MVSINQDSSRVWPEEPHFPLGRTVATHGVMTEVKMEAVYEAMARHERGDWGEMPPEDRALNDQAVKEGGRLMSRWSDEHGTAFYIITEADRSYTTALLTSEY